MLVRLPLLLLLALSLATSQTSHAHSGGLDANGCHAGSQPYHCHRAPSEMVGNRLRCDLGSRSKDCLASSEASQIPQYAKLRRVPRQAILLPHEQDPLRTSTTAT